MSRWKCWLVPMMLNMMRNMVIMPMMNVLSLSVDHDDNESINMMMIMIMILLSLKSTSKSESEKCKRLSEKSHKYSQCRQEKCLAALAALYLTLYDESINVMMMMSQKSINGDDDENLVVFEEYQCDGDDDEIDDDDAKMYRFLAHKTQKSCCLALPLAPSPISSSILLTSSNNKIC